MNPRRYLPRALPKELDPLVPLALDLRWSWSHEADQLWRAIDSALWDETRNAWLILESVSARRLESLSREPEFLGLLRTIVDERNAYMRRTTWCATSGLEIARIAFFSMEFGLSEALPLYSGGLGVLAGDYMKTASDLGMPVIGVGLLYQQGYFRQALDSHGEQVEFNPYNAPSMLPVVPLRDLEGEWAHVGLELPGRRLYLRAWEAQVGRVKLYLLDSNDPLNSPRDRGITAELYAPGKELRLQQEIVLGIGGFRLLEQVVPDVEVCHLNEGHAALAVVARARSFMHTTGADFEKALWCTRAGNVFTTHTPVAAGFDRFEPDLVEQYLGPYRTELGLSRRDFLALGRANPDDDREAFNMANLAVRGSVEVNAVSALHGEVSRHIFEPLFPRWPRHEVPVSHVTNGVHVPSWESAIASDVWCRACGIERWEAPLEDRAAELACVADADLWRMRLDARQSLIEFVRQRSTRQRAARGEPSGDAETRVPLLDPDVLTVGFARRFASYKRPDLLLTDEARLTRLLLDSPRPMQLIVAGKAHPADEAGRALVHAWARFTARSEVRHRVVFLEDYDLRVAEQLIRGVDLWLNTPRRPFEASGTSGMKILANGGLNLSQLDGWWPEAYSPEVGWALGDGREHDESFDRVDAEQLYRLLEREVAPLFYERDGNGIPTRWMARVRQSMTKLTSRFSTHRMLAEYAERFYGPLAIRFRTRKAGDAELGAELASFGRTLGSRWPMLRFGELRVRTTGDRHRFEVELELGELPVDAVRVELYADPSDGRERVRAPMTCREALTSPGTRRLYEVEVPADRPASHFTPRARAFHPQAVLPIEAPFVTWAR